MKYFIIKITVILVLSLFHKTQLYAQSYNTDINLLGKFVARMYNASPFEGVKLVEDYDNQYLLSVVVIDPTKYKGNESVMNRVASVKAMSEANRFFNGSQITMDMIITTNEDNNSNITTEMLEEINEKSIGYVKALSLLTTFPKKDGKQVFIYYKLMDQLTTK